jgi:hypothetical protein
MKESVRKNPSAHTCCLQDADDFFVRINFPADVNRATATRYGRFASLPRFSTS